ncbi:MAG: DUF6159 family protein [Actinomycetota bacterium]|nr:DUF6159 family protein [Actinomycetota bacterium]
MIFKQSLGVLRQDKELVLFPIISGVTMLALLAALAVPTVFLTGIAEGRAENSPWYYVFFFVFYLVGYFVVIFFNTGLISCAHIRLNGGDPRFRDGLRFAADNLSRIAGWALISATVGMILQMIRERAGIFGRIFAGILGLAWNLVTFFVIPVIVFESRGVIDSIKGSASLFKRTWGENVVLRFSVSLILLLLGLVGVVPIVLAALTKTAAVIVPVVIVILLYWVALAILGASLNGIFAAALYNYAITGRVPSAYSPDVIAGAFAQRTGRNWWS